MRNIVVGTAGHIDHGKSTLVKALTGTDPDRLKEEKERGITIDLGFAHMDLGEVSISFVDVPGHERFVKNMLAGVGGIDLVLLVVAADESVMPQTREHFGICRLLGIPAGIVAITKADNADPEMIELVREEVADLVRGSFLESAPVVDLSAKTGRGLAELRQALKNASLQTREKPADRPLRLPIDRAFTMRGFGTVVTGTLTCGTLRREEEVELIPPLLRARVRGLQVHGHTTERAVAGQRTAVNLQGLELDQVGRGMVATVPGLFQPTQLLDATLSLLQDARPLRNLIKVRFHQGTAEVLARILLREAEALTPGESALAQLRLDRPVFCLHGDPFIIRQFSPPITIGGGRILNPHPGKLRTGDREGIRSLRILQSGSMEEKIPVLIAARGRSHLDLNQLNGMLGFPEPELRGYCRRLIETNRLLEVPGAIPLFLLPAHMYKLELESLGLVKDFHRMNPLQRGISREELRKRVFDNLPNEAFRFVLERLVTQGKISLQEETVSLFGREVHLSDADRDLRQSIERAFNEAGYVPLSPAELPSRLGADSEATRRIFFYMLKEKILIRISEDFAYHRDVVEEIKSQIRENFPPGARFNVADFKDLFGLTRKHAIPLLEFLDRERITRRQGNDRILVG